AGLRCTCACLRPTDSRLHALASVRQYPAMRAGVALLALTLLSVRDEPPPSPPLDVGVTEETGTALGQIDVTLLGKPEALAQVGPGSFQVWVGGRKLDHVIADGLC